jgi:transcriptional regulator with XRE-family HTH domain
MGHLKDKLSALASNQPSAWLAKAQFRRKNRHWLKKAAAISQHVLVTMRSRGISQAELAIRTSVSPQQISSILKGQENLNLETIAKLEIALDTQILFLAV